jgi:cyd operon protein YbgT
MWYFSWILGLSFAAAFAALNAMWLELSPGAFKETPHDDSMDPPQYRRQSGRN